MPPQRSSVIELGGSTQRGNPFTPVRELELAPVLKSLALKLPGASSGVVLAPEFRGARGVVDLLAVTRVEDGFIARLDRDASFVTSEADAAALSRLHPRTTRTAAFVAETLGSSERQTRARLQTLVRNGAATRYGNGYRRAPWLTPVGRAYALEAKVADWRKGLSQALRYATWADAAAVVLLDRPRDLADVRLRFKAWRIGLAVGDTWLERPVIGRPDPGRRLAMSEQLASDLAQQRPAD